MATPAQQTTSNATTKRSKPRSLEDGIRSGHDLYVKKHPLANRLLNDGVRAPATATNGPTISITLPHRPSPSPDITGQQTSDDVSPSRAMTYSVTMQLKTVGEAYTQGRQLGREADGASS